MKHSPFSIAVAALVWAFSDDALVAQDKARTHKTDKAQVSQPKTAPAKKKRKQKRTQKPPPRSSQSMLADKPKSAAPQPPAAKAAADDADVHTEGDTSVKTMEFTGLDIEGQLKTPQMLFFMNRMRAEFDRPRLPHRSFMPELEASREDKGL